MGDGSGDGTGDEWMTRGEESGDKVREVGIQHACSGVLSDCNTFKSWLEFSTAFITEFCQKNEVQVAQTSLESLEYFQGHQNVKEYVNEFCDLVQCVNYFKGPILYSSFDVDLIHRFRTTLLA